MASKREKTQKLINEQNNLCYWCEQPMSEEVGSSKNPSGPTIDHLDDKNSPLRGRCSRGISIRRTVAACWKCNNERAKKTSVKKHGDFEFAIKRILMMRKRLKAKIRNLENDSIQKIKYASQLDGMCRALVELGKATGENYFE